MAKRGRTITIQITAEDIGGGVRNDCKNDPIARAIRRTLDLEEHQIFVMLAHVRFYDGADGQNRVTRTLDGYAACFRRQWDDGDDPGPISFQLQVPPGW